MGEVKDVVKAIAVGIVGVVGEFRAERLAIDQDLYAMTCVLHYIDQLDLELARQALTFWKLGVEDEGLGALARPAMLYLDQVGRRDVGEREIELGGNVGDIPEKVTQFLGHALLEQSMCLAVTQVFLVFAE